MTVKDGISAIANEVMGDVQKEAEAAILEAQKEAKEILRLAKEQADQTYREILTQAKVKAEAERRKIASVTEVEMRNRMLKTKEDLVDVAFSKARGKLEEFAATDEYNDYLLKLIGAIAKRIGQKDLIIQVNTRDSQRLTQDTLKRLSKKLHVELALSQKTPDYIGGCIIQTSDGKIIYDNTLDSRLEELKPTLRVEVAKLLFKEDTQP